MHINYISVFWRPVGKLSGTCWKLFGEPVISKEKNPTRGAQWWETLYGFFPFLFGLGGMRLAFWPVPRSRATAEQRDNSSTWSFSVTRLRGSLSRQ